MKAKKERKNQLVVTQEAIADFSILSYAQRLRWLDEMRLFWSKVRSPSAKYVSKTRRGK